MNPAEQRSDHATLSEGRIAAYLRGELVPDDHAALEAALDRNPAWLAVVALLARDAGRDASAEPDPVDARGQASTGVAPDERRSRAAATSIGGGVSTGAVDRLEREHATRIFPGELVGRYRIERVIGEGGMGRVYAARDPELDRPIAIKVLRTADPRAQARLVREARALAQLSSPHVVTILDVGVWRGRMFLAMELVDGPNLREWARATPRSWREILSVYAAAGRGLAAAHAVGVVHRDFKPANAMIRSDGRVVVLDFGLAIAASSPTSESSTPLGPSASAGITTAVGTEGYMAPEQRRRGPCSEKADQYALCVALYEALHGHLPTAVGRRSDARGPWPQRVDRLLARGLEDEPSARHPDLHVLVDALAECARPRRSRWRVIAGSAAVVGVAIVTFAFAASDEPCSGSVDALAASPADARAAADAIAALDQPWGARTSADVESGLVAYSDRWIAAHREICRATQVLHTQSEAELEARMRCLDEGRRRLGALVAVLRDADVAAASHAVTAVAALPSPAECRDAPPPIGPSALPADEAARAEIAAIHGELARVDALRRAQRWDAAGKIAAETMLRAAAVGHAATEADAVLAAAGVAQERGDPDEAERLLRRAVLAGEAGGHDDAVTTAWNRLIWVVGHELARHDEGRECARRADEWAQRLGRPRQHEVARLRNLGWIEHDDGADDVALLRFGDALALAEMPDAEGVVSRDEIALVLNGMGAAALGAGNLSEAGASFSRAADELTAELGPDHPDVARVRNNFAAVKRALGEPDVAVEIFERNLAIFDATFGAAHSDSGTTRINLAVALLDLGKFDAALEHAAAAVTSLTTIVGGDHPNVARAMTIRGDASVQLGRLDAAVADFEAALVIETETLGADHPSVAILQSNLGDAYYARGELARAELHQRRALAILEGALGEDHPNVAFVLVALGLTLRDAGRPDEALAMLRRAVTHADATLLPNALTRVGAILLARGEVGEALAELERARALQLAIATSDALAGDTLRELAKARWAAGLHTEARAAAADAIRSYEAVDDRGNADAVRAWVVSLRD